MLMVTWDWTNFSALANIGSIILTIAIAIGAYFGFRTSKDKGTSDQVNEIIANWKGLSESLSATVEELREKIAEQDAILQQKDIQISKLENQIAQMQNNFKTERLQMQADFEIEKKVWLDHIRRAEEALKNGRL